MSQPSHPLARGSGLDDDPALDRFLGGVPEILRGELWVLWQRFAEACEERGASPELPGLDLTELGRVWAASRFVAGWCVRQPARLETLLTSGDLDARYGDDDMLRRVDDGLSGAEDEDALKRALREVRNREMVRIAWRDIAARAELGEILDDLTALADACIQKSLSRLESRAREQWGTPRGADGEAQRLVVLGLGKLGGGELNFSSDIDLIFAFPESGQTDGPRAVENEQFFTRLAQRLVQTLNEPTAEGVAFRVDTRLRPFGDSGPLVLNFASMENYYASHGREWERYAFVKARPVVDPDGAGSSLLETLRPFVYRRYIDYGVIESLRNMKSLIAREVQRQGLADDIKMGRGGIREIEFIGQVFQLIRGGYDPALQDRRILTVLERLREREIIAAHMARDLDLAYRFLRTVENRLQQVADSQTHELPTDAVERERLAFSLGFEGWPECAATIDHHRRRVQEEFEQVFASPHTDHEDGDGDADLEMLWEGALSVDEERRVLQSAGMADPESARTRLHALREGTVHRSLSTTGRERLARLLPLLVSAAGASPVPDTALSRLLQIIEAIARRSTYLSLLAENPMALSQLARLCAASPWISELLRRHPVLLDELLDPRTLYSPPDRAAMRSELTGALSACEDLEEEMDALRRFHQAVVLRVAAADITASVPIMRVSDYLTDLAEVLLEKVLELAWRQLVERHGTPRCRDGAETRSAGFAIVGYGKLGGIELGYGSDLDLVFLHDSAGAEQLTDGERSVDNAVFFARLAQRIIHLLSTRTPAGVCYEVDTRLRPSGRQGLLVSSLQGFEDYQRNQAWTWEHQALVRARVVAGSEPVARAFAELRESVLRSARDPVELRREVAEMRARMRENLDESDDRRFDVKQGAGGVADIEFMVQYEVLLWAAEHPAVLEVTDNIRLLERFAEAGLMDGEACALLADAYRAYRRRIHELSLQEQPAVVPAGEFGDYREGVTRIWRELMEA